MQLVAVLFAHNESHYKGVPGVDVWDAERNALQWPGGTPIIAHPPCRLWSRLRYFSTAPRIEKAYAVWAIEQARRWGGVVEHPAYSRLWEALSLPRPGTRARDKWGGWTMSVPQQWWGHVARKATWLYVVGCAPSNIPPVPYCMGEPEKVIASKSARLLTGQKHPSKQERELTPPAFCSWLIDLARKCA